MGETIRGNRIEKTRAKESEREREERRTTGERESRTSASESRGDHADVGSVGRRCPLLQLKHTIKLTSGHTCNVILSAVPVVFVYPANVAEPPVLIAIVGIVLVEYNVFTVLSPPNMEES